MQRGLREPGVEVDAETVQRCADALEQELDAGARDGIDVGRGRVGDALGQLGHVGALVAILGHRLPARPGLDRLAQLLHLAAVVVDVVLALDGVAGHSSSRASASP